MLSDPFLISGPACINFSGGRTSGYMLWRIIQAHGGALPDNVVVCFANTGREMPATLDFVAECASRWRVRVRWLEYRHQPGKPTFEEVSHNSASRSGEPFDMLLAAKRVVPDPFRRFCTIEMKVKTVARFLKAEFGWECSGRVVGLRADEGARVERLRKTIERLDSKDAIHTPLYDAGITELEVRQFWREQLFDLRLRDSAEGNCDGCMMKSSSALGEMFRRYPDRMTWWVDAEKRGRGKTMVVGRSYAQIARVAANQGVLAFDDATPCEQAMCGI
jgi:3'-phosphoadenosine 5'-phosphosulfate sulfotransferase (PAPS reductase)/FAD synthetase